MSDFDDGRDNDNPDERERSNDPNRREEPRRPKRATVPSRAPLEQTSAPEDVEEEIAPEEQGPGLNPSVLLAAVAILALVGFGLFYSVLVAHSHHAAVVAVVSPTPVPADQQGGSTVFTIPSAPPGPATPTPAGARPSPVATVAGAAPAATVQPQPAPAQTEPPQQNAPTQTVPALQPAYAQTTNTSSVMQIDQPPAAGSQTSPRAVGAAGNPQDQAALAEVGTAPHIIYTPIRNGAGQISAVVPRFANTPLRSGTASFVTPEEAASLAGSTASRNLGSNGGKVGYVLPPSDYILQPTTVIPIRLVSRVVSDIPGTVRAIVTSDIYDSVTHSHILIPHGTVAEGVYDNGLLAGQSRLFMAWPLLVFPPYAPWNAREYALGGQPGIDALGTAGLAGKTDYHRGDVIRSAAFLTVLGTAEGLLTPNTSVNTINGGQSSITQQTASAAGAQLANIGNKLIDQQLQRAPTITLDPPYETAISITRDLPLAAYEFDPTGS